MARQERAWSRSGPERRETQRRPHLVVLSWRDFAHPDAGGSERYVLEVTSRLVDRGWAVTQVSADWPGAPRQTCVRGVRVVRRGGRITVFAHALLWHFLGRFGPYDAVLDVHNGMPFLSPLVTRRPVLVLVHHVHREQWRVLFGRALGCIGWWLESKVAVRVYRHCPYVAVSENTMADLRELGTADDCVIIRNGSASVSSPTPKSPRPTICVLGRLVPHKRVERAIEAVAALRKELPGLNLSIVGAGDWEGSLRRLAEASGVSDAVTFHGFVDPATRDRLLGEAWVLAMPSMKEGWGLAVMEAAGQQTPAVGFSDAGGLSESIQHGSTGLLVNDQDEFVAALRLLLTDRPLRERYGRTARARAAGFSWAAAADDMGRRLQEVTGLHVVPLVPGRQAPAPLVNEAEEGSPAG